MTASLSSRWERLFDVVAAATVAAVPITILVSETGPTMTWSATTAAGVLLLLAGAALVTLRRRFPLGTGIATVAVSGLVLLVPDYALAVWVLAEIVLFSTALRVQRQWTLAVASVHAGLLYAGAIIAFRTTAYDPLAMILPVWTGAVVAFALALRSQQDYVDAVEDRARAAVTARDAEVKRRLGEERLRIARDLHDSIANSLTVIDLQASTAQRHLGDDPARAREALHVVRATSRRAVSELAGILAVLRDDTAADDHSLPAATNIPHLIELFTGAGGRIDADLTALDDAQLPLVASAALYRIVQEALTNAQRHGTGSVSLRTGVADGHAWIEMRNTVADAPSAAESGFGIIGMHERAALAGGALESGRDGSEFVVRAEVPTT